ncbi:hypothetical protein LLEC1_03073 [Akanthomyces lecanii]|uniref:CHCH domain-containing protein n=1 Tax=Cordyceps confragosa TaxID=2714763 RepID=A0A179I635_CORDF|nr:hypothetical protein LLEC1_03073 [Akanthomyces lecanii]
MSTRRPQYVYYPAHWPCNAQLMRASSHPADFKISRSKITDPSSLPGRFNQQVLIDATPLPDDVPAVKEIGASSAPLLSASFFIGARCRDYNDDYMQCKTENPGRGEFDCMKEGRRVTRCAQSVIKDINTHCLTEFRKHWECLDDRNHQLWQCRPAEWKLNKCVFDNLKLEKKIPDQPSNVVPVELRPKQIFADFPVGPGEGKPFVVGQSKQ